MSVEHIDAMTGEILPSLAECEETIARGVRGYVEAGEALRTIRDARLYRETHGTFEDYCRERWGWNKDRSNQLIRASEVSTTVLSLGAPAPANEGQARELVGLPAETAAQIMRTAAETGQTVTARVIRETRVQITAPKETTKETPKTAAPSRLAIPQPPRYGGNRPKHAQVIGNALTTTSGICAALDEISELDGSLTAEKAASYAAQLGEIIGTMERVGSMLSAVTPESAVTNTKR